MAMVAVLPHGNVRLGLMDSQCRSGNQDGFPEDAHSNTARLTHHHDVLCSNSVGSVIFEPGYEAIGNQDMLYGLGQETIRVSLFFFSPLTSCLLSGGGEERLEGTGNELAHRGLESPLRVVKNRKVRGKLGTLP